jgi:hypothetical protein
MEVHMLLLIALLLIADFNDKSVVDVDLLV